MGYSVQLHSDSRKALEEITEMPEKYQIVVADLRMNGMDGIQLLREIRHINREIRIVLTTAYDMKGEIKEELSALPIPHIILRKPFDIDKLRAVLERSAPPQLPPTKTTSSSTGIL